MDKNPTPIMKIARFYQQVTENTEIRGDIPTLKPANLIDEEGKLKTNYSIKSPNGRLTTTFEITPQDKSSQIEEVIEGTVPFTLKVHITGVDGSGNKINKSRETLFRSDDYRLKEDKLSYGT